MDAPSSQEKIVEPPRNLFFGVEDRRLGGRAGLEEKYFCMERGRRHQLAKHVIDSAIQVANAVRTVQSFDKTGNAEQALDHLSVSLDDLVKRANNFTAEVEESVDRYGDGLEALATRDAAEARAALNAPAAVEPTPQVPAAAGPHVPSPSDVAQVQANLNRALDRISR